MEALQKVVSLGTFLQISVAQFVLNPVVSTRETFMTMENIGMMILA